MVKNLFSKFLIKKMKIQFSFVIILLCATAVSGKLIDNLHWDYCKKPQIKNSPLEITELEVDPFPFLKGHEIHFNMVKTIVKF